MDPESSSSSTLMSQDLGLDPSDPLNLLLHNHDQRDQQDTDTDSPGTPPDWNTLSSMWPPVEDQKMDFQMDFGLMDMSFDPAMGIEPNALHYAYNAVPDPFQFTFESPTMSSSSSSESGSTSGSFSPLVAYSPPSSEPDEDPATELASRVRKTAGIMLAVPINQEHEQKVLQYQQQTPTQAQQMQQMQQQHTPQPPAFTTTPVPAAVLANTPATTVPQPRPKTSHTTIERRYRTNLNARIQSLRQAVPALRVVDRAAAAKAGEPIDDEGPDDIVDARGFVDGVKVARKCSKANVLGKAVEYIRVLKNREARLARELSGLKTLLGGLVGGRELLHEWEREWAARFGGPETDEIGDNNAPGGDDDDEDEDDEESDGGGGRKRKKPKVDAVPKPKPKAASAPAGDGEKKKRGRPRKVVPLPVSALGAGPALSTSAPLQTTSPSIHSAVPADGPQRQYLLGAFALFSFFANANVSTPSSSSSHHHEGHVLTRVPLPRAEGLGLLQMFHLLVSAAVLASVLLPLGRSIYGRLRASSPAAGPVKIGPANTAPVAVTEKETETESAPPSPTSSEEIDDDTDADTELSRSSMSSGDDEYVYSTRDEPFSAGTSTRDEAEACILDASTPLATRLRTALRLYNTPSPASTVSTPPNDDDRRLLALLVRPVPVLGARLASRFWDAGLGLEVDEAARRVASTKTTTRTCKSGVLRALEAGLVVERLRAAGVRAFVGTVLGGDSNADADEESDSDSAALAAARTLGGRVGTLGARVGRVLNGGDLDLDLDSDVESDGEDSDVAAQERDVARLLRAIVLYRRVFGATTPKGGTRARAAGADARALRRTLGSSDVFEDARVEEARDRVVDLLTGEQ
ncbi:hypothetical protein C8R43DRAFT_1232486 [Mycena crocata]|nr:hypothetical protein C8R43DRAFT_1232486 [Mycena crocata]